MTGDRRAGRDGLRPWTRCCPRCSTRKEARQWRLFHLVREWPRIVGPRVAEVTAPAWFRHDVLWIYVQDSAAMQHLQYSSRSTCWPASTRPWRTSRPAICAGALQPVAEPDRVRNPAAEARIDPNAKRPSANWTASIPDPACREALVRLWRTIADHEPGPSAWSAPALAPSGNRLCWRRQPTIASPLLRTSHEHHRTHRQYPAGRAAPAQPRRRTVQLFGKLESRNPGGSIKDRVALSMVEAGERSGELTRDKILLEATSGNTGIGMAMMCAASATAAS